MKRYPSRKVFLLEHKNKVKPYALLTMREKYLAQNIEKIGILDIETTGLKADFGFILTYAILVRDVKTGKTTIRKAFITPDDFEYARRKGNPDLVDKRILTELMSDIADIDYWLVS